MQFLDYYRDSFRPDVHAVLSGLPSLHPHGSDELTIQPRTISLANPVVRRWGPEQRWAFASALYLTVLSDQVCYTHFGAAYPRFRELTQYPKWRGDCPGACWHHIHPINVFRSIGTEVGQHRDILDLPYKTLPDGLINGMETEVTDFVSRYLDAVDADDFWARCDAELPTGFRLLYMASRATEAN